MEAEKITPEAFWKLYSERLSNLSSEEWKAYKNDKQWTKVALSAAEKVCRKMGTAISKDKPIDIRTQKEYLRLDLIAYTRRKKFDWDIRIAFEHENDRNMWPDELCKLCHVVADLRVLTSYHRFEKDGPVEAKLEAKLEVLGEERVNRIKDSDWLFIFGPSEIYTHRFEAFRLDKGLRVERITNSGIEVVPNV